jgi:deazaflavin-dependent oxidoreductase (nitroreductase family)
MTTTADPRAAYAEATRQLIEDLRAHNGTVTQGRFTGRPVFLLHTRGARSGADRIAPLVYSTDGDRWVVLASRGGSPNHPAWYHNLVAHPEVTVEVGGETVRARATTAQGEEHERLFAAHAAKSPIFSEYQARTSRTIPVVVLERLPAGA